MIELSENMSDYKGYIEPSNHHRQQYFINLHATAEFFWCEAPILRGRRGITKSSDRPIMRIYRTLEGESAYKII